MEIIFEYFWLLCGLWVGLVGAIAGKVRSKKQIELGKIEEIEVNRYLKGWFFCIFLPCLLLWVIQTTIPGDVFVDFLTWPNPQKAIALVATSGAWVALLVWVIFLGGSIPLSKTFRLVGNFPEFMLKPLSVKIFVILIVLSGIISLVSRI